MLIDWFTVIAQIVNFLILAWLLKRFLYQPILHAIDAREQRIAAELADADTKKSEALKERDEFKQKNIDFDRQKNAMFAKAVDVAKAAGQQMLNTAREDADVLRSKRQEALRSEQNNLHEAITRRTRDEVFAIARKTLADLAGASLEERMTDIFVQRLGELDDKDASALQAAFAASTSPLLVRTTFELQAAQQTAIAVAIKARLGDRQLKFETAPELVSGIELSTNGHKLAWSIAEYLASLANSIDTLLKAAPKTDTKPA